MRKNREQIKIYTLTNVWDGVFLARKAKVWKAVLKNEPSMLERQLGQSPSMTLLSRPPSRKELGRESRDF